MGNRLQEIVIVVEQQGFLSVRELSQKFDVSEVTIRRDLQRLHDEHRLLRTYGGVVPLTTQAQAGSAILHAPVVSTALRAYRLSKLTFG